jgi:hypothetical protein
LRGVAITLQSLGYLALQRAELQVAAARLHESLRVAQGIHFTELIGVDLDGFGVIAGRADEPAAAARLFGAAAVILEGVGASLWGVEKQLHAQVESVLRSRLGEDHFARQLAGGRGLDIDQAIAYARSVVPDPASAEGAGSASGRSLPDPLDQLP